MSDFPSDGLLDKPYFSFTPLLDMRPEGIDARFLHDERTLGLFINLNILSYELGYVQKRIQYMVSANVNIEDPIKRQDVYKAHRNDAKLEFSDLIIQVKSFCERMGWDFKELEKLGLERYRERMEELAQGKI